MRRALDILLGAHFAPAIASAAAAAQVRAKTGLDLSKARARSGFARGHLLDVVLYVPGGTGSSAETEAAEQLVRLIVGEELYEHWVGTVSATPTTRGGPLTVLNSNAEEQAALPVELLLDTVRAAIAGLRLGLPPLPEPGAPEGDDWVLFELEPEPAPDFAAQDDLVLGATRTPELKKSFLRGEPFYSGRFCSSAALFTYLKYESVERDARARFVERARYEEAVTRALPAEEGVLVGLGLGLRYGYLDLALLAPDCFRQRLIPALLEAGLIERAWLLFCDSELEREFIPVHEGLGAPFLG